MRIKFNFETRGDRAVTCRDVCAGLLRDFSAEPHHIGCFFVAFLKFPPIVQSGSILFRKLDRQWAALSAEPPPSAACDWLRCSCVANDIIILQSDRKFCNFLIKEEKNTCKNTSRIEYLQLPFYYQKLQC